MTEEHPGWEPSVLRNYRTARRYSLERLAGLIANLTGELDFTPPLASGEMIRRHETGASFPGTDYQAAYTHVFGATPVQLGFRDAFPFESPDVHVPSGGSHTLGGASEVTWQGQPADTPSGHEEDATNRRRLMELMAVGGVTVAAEPVLTPAERLLALEHVTSGDGALSVAEAQFTNIIEAYPFTPPPVLLGHIVALQQFTDGIGQLSLAPPGQTRLWRLAAVQAGLRGWVHNNAGQPKAARASLMEAYRRGVLLEDNQLIAWVRYMQAMVEEYDGHTKDAERYALDGLRYAGTGPQRAILLVEPLTKVSAARGDLEEVDRRVGEAGEIVEQFSAEDHGPFEATIIDNLSSYHPVQFATASSTAYARLGRPERTSSAVSSFVPLIEARGSYRRSYLRLDQALAAIRSNDPDLERAASSAEQGLELSIPSQAAHVGRRLNMILRASEPFRTHPAIRDLAENARMWRADRAASVQPR
jgi:hypothetical protein